MTLRMIDTFSGIGGFSLAAQWLGGIEIVQFVEREPYCHRILAKHWPDVPIHDDICTFNPKRARHQRDVQLQHLADVQHYLEAHLMHLAE